MIQYRVMGVRMRLLAFLPIFLMASALAGEISSGPKGDQGKDCEKRLRGYSEEYNRRFGLLSKLTKAAKDAKKNPDYDLKCGGLPNGSDCENRRAKARKPIDEHGENLRALASVIESQKKTAIECVRYLSAEAISDPDGNVAAGTLKQDGSIAPLGEALAQPQGNREPSAVKLSE